MKILYLSCHSVLEYQELRLFTEMDSEVNANLDVEVFSMGAYMNPTQSGDYMRSVIPKGRLYADLYGIAMQCDKDNIHPELIKWADVIVSMHNAKLPGVKWEQPWIAQNWSKFTEAKKKVVWRSIGQSTPAIERELKPFRTKGLKVVRYSPREERIPEYCGSDAMIRFAEDPEDYKGWVGDNLQVITFAQSFKKRGEHLGFSLWDKVTANYRRKVFGTGNEDLGAEGGGQVAWQHLKNELRENRVYFYYGTQPASYTLSFIEAMMTGIPIVAVGPKLRNTIYNMETYEIGDIISNGVNGFISDNIDELRGYIDLLLRDKDRAKVIGDAGRNTAIQLFERKHIMGQWADLFKGI